MSKLIRLGVVGYGSRGASMSATAAALDHVQLAAVCEVKPDRLDRAKQDLANVALFDDYDAMLASDKIDAVLVETPGDNHAAFCAKALAAQVSVLSDVPCVYSYDDATLLWDAHFKSSATFMFGANPNFWGFVDAGVDARNKGLLGEPYLLEAEYIHDVRHLFASSPWRSTFPPIMYCTHSLGPLLRFIEEDIESAVCFDSGSHISRQQGQHDVMTALFRTPSNVLVRITCSFCNHFKGGPHYYRVMGTNGVFERTASRGSLQPARTLLNSTQADELKDITELPVGEARPQCTGASDGHGGADSAMLKAFITSLVNKTPSPLSLREGLRMSLPGVFAAESALNGGRVTRVRYPWRE
ncbi:MAG: Gfo/Idh/MocA family oxidoreductase [Planctomycetes bacterium]|jgi:predicted dehydrogenase|nr:Gfo/Idh/MocA family oxidoreductase [Planctomycetota bacterium]